jgi:hypothetical protein
MAFGPTALKQLALVSGLSIVIGAALVLATATAYNATQPNRTLPFGLDAYLDRSTAETLVRWKYQFLIDKNVEVCFLTVLPLCHGFNLFR